MPQPAFAGLRADVLQARIDGSLAEFDVFWASREPGRS